MNILPAITLYNPWAVWIMRGWKTIETRTHDRFKCLNNRTILIHAGMRTDISEQVTDNPYLTRVQILQEPKEMIGGYILGTARVYNFSLLSEHESDLALIDCGTVQRWGLFLTEINRFKDPIPAKGGMGIWYYDLSTKQKVKLRNEQQKEIDYQQA